MTPKAAQQSATLLEILARSLRECDSPADGVERPAAILWTDPDRQWARLVSAWRKELPELLVLGEYEPAEHMGPAIWLRCVVDRELEEPALPADRAPILYLPGVGRQMLRAGEDCPPELRPLVELLYRGTAWKHPNGQDWTVTAFLGQRGVGLEVARDENTRDAVLRALPELMRTPLGVLRERHLQAEDFDRLLTTDVVRDLLLWMGEPVECEQRMGAERWEALRNQARLRFSLDPARDGELTAAERVVAGDGPWEDVWKRFTEAPAVFPGLVQLLRRVQPRELFRGRDRLPEENAREEAALRAELEALAGRPSAEICRRVRELENSHGIRRQWVWARLGDSPLARALSPLVCLAELGATPLGGDRAEDFAKAYAEGAWRVDASAWKAVAVVSTAADRSLIGAVVHAILAPWLDASARAFQEVVLRQGLDWTVGGGAALVDEGECLLFADGLRFDVAQRLAEILEGHACRVRLSWRWAGLPTVTATGKPLVTPARTDLEGGELGGDFAPRFREGGQTYYAEGLRQAIGRQGYQIVGEGDLGVPEAEKARAWTESADLDRCGHDEQERLPERLGAELERLAERIRALLGAGWKRVRVVTDHGWLWTPRGLPKVSLPRHLTESRWARCAALEGSPQVDAHLFPWTWNAGQFFATAPGASCFNQSPAYAHGGVSVQECLIPVLDVVGSAKPLAVAAIRSIIWRGMRCMVEAVGEDRGLLVDLRLETSGGLSVVPRRKSLDEGTASLLVADDKYEGADLVLVLIDESGRVLAQRRTRVGEDT